MVQNVRRSGPRPGHLIKEPVKLCPRGTAWGVFVLGFSHAGAAHSGTSPLEPRALSFESGCVTSSSLIL